jgi:ubiquinone/menaquinone biosynthesis C-methylase UbiE
MIDITGREFDPVLRMVNVHKLFFEGVARDYDGWLHGAHRKSAAALIEIARPAAGESVLDAGCGTGLATNLAAAAVGKSGRVVGVDISQMMLERARQQARSGTLLYQASIDGLMWFRDQTFDLVMACDVLGYLDAPQDTLDELARVLRSPGRLALSVARRSLMTPAQESSRQVIERVLRTQPFEIPRAAARHSLIGEPDVLEEMLVRSRLRIRTLRTFVTGVRAGSAAEWLEIERCSNPRAFFLISALGPSARQALGEEMDWTMRRQGEDAFRFHQALTLVIATPER